MFKLPFWSTTRLQHISFRKIQQKTQVLLVSVSSIRYRQNNLCNASGPTPLVSVDPSTSSPRGGQRKFLKQLSFVTSMACHTMTCSYGRNHERSCVQRANLFFLVFFSKFKSTWRIVHIWCFAWAEIWITRTRTRTCRWSERFVLNRLGFEKKNRSMASWWRKLGCSFGLLIQVAFLQWTSTQITFCQCSTCFKNISILFMLLVFQLDLPFGLLLLTLIDWSLGEKQDAQPRKTAHSDSEPFHKLHGVSLHEDGFQPQQPTEGAWLSRSNSLHLHTPHSASDKKCWKKSRSIANCWELVSTLCSAFIQYSWKTEKQLIIVVRTILHHMRTTQLFKSPPSDYSTAVGRNSGYSSWPAAVWNQLAPSSGYDQLTPQMNDLKQLSQRKWVRANFESGPSKINAWGTNTGFGPRLLYLQLPLVKNYVYMYRDVKHRIDTRKEETIPNDSLEINE